MPNPALKTALMGADGDTPVRITRVEIEILDGGQCRWTIWNGPRRLFSHMARRADVPAMLRDTETILDVGMARGREGN